MHVKFCCCCYLCTIHSDDQHLSTLVLVELSLVVVFGVVVLVDVVVGLEAWWSVLNIYQKEIDILSDWSQTRLAGMDLAKSSIDWNSSSERSTAIDQYDSLGRRRCDSLLALASIRDGVTDLGKTQIPRLINQEMRMVAPWTPCFSAILTMVGSSRSFCPSVPPRGEYAWGRMSFFSR